MSKLPALYCCAGLLLCTVACARAQVGEARDVVRVEAHVLTGVASPTLDLSMAGMVGPERPAGVYGALLRDLVRRGYTGALTLSDTLLVNMIRGTGHLRPSGTLIYVTLLDPAGDTLTRTVHYAALSPGLDPTTRLHNTPLQYRRAPYYLYVTVSACTV